MEEPLIFDLSVQGKKAYSLPEPDVPHPDVGKWIPSEYLSQKGPGLPELSELEVVRHFTRLSQLNYSVDTAMYPLGSCTMKYNPKVNEEILQNEGWLSIHPYQPEEISQGVLRLLYDMQLYICEISGMDAVSLHPAAGAHGELLGMLMIRAYYKDKGEQNRIKIVVPDSSHGTNPCSAHIAGHKVVTIPSNAKGEVDLDKLNQALDNDTAAVMLTNPNTLGIFETRIFEIADMVHSRGALLYCDGANLNALIGRFRPGDMGFDIMHLNLHKTFSTPHGGGGPGSGPVACKKELSRFLPVPSVGYKNKKYYLDYNKPKSIGKIHTFYGNIGVIIRAYAYIRALGPEGLKKASSYAVLHANYMRMKLKKDYFLPYKRLCMHEFVISAEKQAERGVRAQDIAKRLLDYGLYAPTIYFPSIVHETLMIEPTETESKTALDNYISILIKINKEDPSLVKKAPYSLPVTRLDEVAAAKNPNLRWIPQN